MKWQPVLDRSGTGGDWLQLVWVNGIQVSIHASTHYLHCNPTNHVFSRQELKLKYSTNAETVMGIVFFYFLAQKYSAHHEAVMCGVFSG
jgi:hypothetical protein